jgi:hypothetical protein
MFAVSWTGPRTHTLLGGGLYATRHTKGKLDRYMSLRLVFKPQMSEIIRVVFYIKFPTPSVFHPDNRAIDGIETLYK